MPKLRDQTARLLDDPTSLAHRALAGLDPDVAAQVPPRPGERPGPYGSPPRSPEEDSAGLRRLARHLYASDLYWVTPQMSALAVSSAESLPSVRWSVVDRPDGANFGLLVWDGGIGMIDYGGVGVPTAAASWAPHEDGLAVCVYMTRYDMAAAVERVTGQPAPVDDIPPLVPVWSDVLPTGDEWTPASELGWWRTALTTLWASWTLMQQPTVADRQRAEVDRAIRRSYGRAGRPAPEVTIVDLRRVYRPPRERDPDEPPSRQYRHRWVVSGHWRDQPYGPGGTLRRRQWIPSYIKGPTGAPLLRTTRVNVWRR